MWPHQFSNPLRSGSCDTHMHHTAQTLMLTHRGYSCLLTSSHYTCIVVYTVHHTSRDILPRMVQHLTLLPYMLLCAPSHPTTHSKPQQGNPFRLQCILHTHSVNHHVILCTRFNQCYFRPIHPKPSYEFLRLLQTYRADYTLCRDKLLHCVLLLWLIS